LIYIEGFKFKVLSGSFLWIAQQKQRRALSLNIYWPILMKP